MPASAQLDQLRELLLGPEQAELERLRKRVEEEPVTAEQVAKVIAEAVALRTRRDTRLKTELTPMIEEALRFSIQKNPRILSDALYPIIGAAIRKATASALQQMTESIDQTLETGASFRGLQWRFEAWRTGRPFAEVVVARSALYRVEQVFLIHRKAGLLLRHEAAAGTDVKDSDIVSAMLTAIQDFVQDSFGGKESDALESVQMGEFRLRIVRGPHAILAAVVRGIPPGGLIVVLQQTIEAIHEEMGVELANFKGDAAPFEKVEPHLRRCLLGLAPPDGKRRGFFRRWWPAFALAAVALLVWAGLSAWHRWQWRQFVAEASRVPGLVITSAEPYVLRGVRDPSSRDLATLLDAAGVPRDRAQLELAPFLSLDPAFATIRQFEAQTQRVRSYRFFFETGSSSFAPGAADELAREVRELVRLSDAAGRPSRVQLIGRADAEGTVEQNTKLAQERADRVAEALTSRGIPAGRLSPERDPNIGTDRSVSFEVIQ